MKRSRLLKRRKLFTLCAFNTNSAIRGKIKTIRDKESQAQRRQLLTKPSGFFSTLTDWNWAAGLHPSVRMYLTLLNILKTKDKSRLSWWKKTTSWIDLRQAVNIHLEKLEIKKFKKNGCSSGYKKKQTNLYLSLYLKIFHIYFNLTPCASNSKTSLAFILL